MIANLLPHPAYKPSGLEWLPNIPAHWGTDRGKWLLKKMKRPVRDTDEVVTCFRDGVVTLRKNRRTEGFTESLQEIGYQGIRAGDLVIHAMDAFAGAIGVADSDGKGTPVYSVCRPEPHVNAYYFAHLLREMARSQWIAALATGIRERSTDFRYATLASQRLPLPPLAGQRAIACYLDHADRRIQRYIEAKEKLIGLLQEARQATIHRAVTRGLDPDVPLKSSGVEWLGDVPAHWDIRPLKHWVGINETVLSEATNPDFTFRYLEIGAVSTGLLTQEYRRIRFDVAPSRARRVVKDGDTIISTVRPYLKAVWFADEIDGDLICSTGFAVLTPRSRVVPRYIGYLAQSSSFTKRMTAESVGIAYPAISESKFGSFPVCTPPLPEQHVIAAHLDRVTAAIDVAIDTARRQVEFMTEYRASLIAHVVTGKLDVRAAAERTDTESS